MSIQLTDEFHDAFSTIENTNQNVFLTGKAGTGKSTFLDCLRASTKKQIAILAPTGVAALNVGGSTIHSFFGFPVRVMLPEIGDIVRKCDDKALFKNLNIIVIDEVSMVRADIMDCINEFLKGVMETDLPFGGKQLLLIGDLFQLPPVVSKEEGKDFYETYKTPYFFGCISNHDLNLKIIELTKVFRQKDPVFISILNGIRENNYTPEILNTLNQRFAGNSEVLPDKGIVLASTNKIVNEINDKNIRNLPGNEKLFIGVTTGGFDIESCPAPLNLKLKIGAQVMLVNNDRDQRWVNGSLGVATHISDTFAEVLLSETDTLVYVEAVTWEKYKYYWDKEKEKVEKKVIGSYTQLPIKLAWAITIHKSQGKTFDQVVVDLGFGAFSHGQTYVALSRCRSLQGITLRTRVRSRDIIVNEVVRGFLHGPK